MFEIDKSNNTMTLATSIFAIFLSGIFFGIIYFLLNNIDIAFHTQNCVINSNAYVSSCQDLWELALYPVLALKSVFVWLSYFFIFALVIGLLMLGYKSGENPSMIGILLISTIAFTYFGIELSNVYRSMLDNPTFLEIMLPFNIYNKIMLNFPWFVSFLGLGSTMLGLVNWQRARVNSSNSDLDY